MPHTETDFANIRTKIFDKNSRPAEWPDGVFAVSLDGLSLLGAHEKTNRLYWDGREIVTRSIIRLGKIETWLATFGARTSHLVAWA